MQSFLVQALARRQTKDYAGKELTNARRYNNERRCSNLIAHNDPDDGRESEVVDNLTQCALGDELFSWDKLYAGATTATKERMRP